MNENWYRWVQASIADYFQSGLKPAEFRYWPEYKPKEQGDRFELRTLGPDFDSQSGNEYKVTVKLNLAIVTMASPSDSTVHPMRVGKGLKLFRNCIGVKRVGPYEASDDKRLVGTLELQTSILTSDLPTDPVSKTLRTTLEATYVGCFEGDKCA